MDRLLGSSLTRDPGAAPSPPAGTTVGRLLPRLMAIGVLVAAALIVALPASRRFLLEAKSYLWPPDLEGLRDFLVGYGGTAWLVSSALMVAQSLAAPIPAVPITLANALIYGTWLGCLVSWGSAQLAALVCFYLARGLGRPFVERLFPRRTLGRFDRFFERYGLASILIGRLVPFLSFDVVSYAAGLTPVRLVPFLVATGLGQLPACIAYSYAGAHLATEPSRSVIAVLTFLGLLALVGGLLYLWSRRRRGALTSVPGEPARPESPGSP